MTSRLNTPHAPGITQPSSSTVRRAALTLLSALALGACSKTETGMTANEPPSASVGNEIDDSVTTTRIKAALLAEADIKSLAIEVETRKGEVILSGHAQRQSQIDLAGRVAQGISGVRQLNNQLALTGPAETVGETTDDILVTGRVKTALLDDAMIKSFDISVATKKGDVRLTGFVDNQAQIDRSIAVARAVQGVHSIHDELQIKK